MAQKQVQKVGGSSATYAGFGLQFVGAILLFAYLGSWLDRFLGTRPLFLIIGVFVGAGGAFYSMYRRVMSEAAAAKSKSGSVAGKGDGR